MWQQSEWIQAMQGHWLGQPQHNDTRLFKNYNHNNLTPYGRVNLNGLEFNDHVLALAPTPAAFFIHKYLSRRDDAITGIPNISTDMRHIMENEEKTMKINRGMLSP